MVQFPDNHDTIETFRRIEFEIYKAPIYVYLLFIIFQSCFSYTGILRLCHANYKPWKNQDNDDEINSL